MIDKLFQGKIKLGQGTRAAKTQAIENLYNQPKTGIKTKRELNKLTKSADKLHKPFEKPKQLRKIHFRPKNNIWNVDLAMMTPENDYKYILTILNGYTKYA